MEPQASNPKEFFKDFCEQTSLHGWNFLAYSKFKCIHVAFWLSVIIGASFVCMYCIYQSTDEFIEATVDFQTETLTEPLDNVFFPSIYISNKNVYRKSILMEVLQDPILSNISYNQIVNVWSRQKFWGFPQTFEEKVVDTKMRTSTKWMELFSQYRNESLEPPGYIVYPDTTKFQQQHSLDSLNNQEENVLGYYFLQLMGHSRLDDYLLMMYFSGKGIAYFGGGMAGEAIPTNTFVPYFKNGITEPGSRSGMRNGITFHLDAETYDFTYNDFQTEGFDIGTKHHFDYPSMLDTIEVQPGQTTMIAVSSELIHTDEGIRKRFGPDDTKCYFDGEVNLDKFFTYYSMTNCLFMAYLQQVAIKCNCSIIDGQFNECVLKSKGCVNDNQIRVGIHQTILSDGTNRTCYARCNDQTFTTSVSTSNYPNLQTFPYFGFDFCLVMQKIARSCQSIKKLALEDKYPGICTHFNALNPDLKSMLCGFWDYDQLKDQLSDQLIDFVKIYAKENTARVTIYMKDPYVKKIKRVEKISRSSFISNIGGLLGLFQGISVISCFEIGYLLCFFVKDKLMTPNSIDSPH